MKTYLPRIAAGTGFIRLIATPAIADTPAATPAAVPAWLCTAAALLFAGRGFTFQQK